MAVAAPLPTLYPADWRREITLVGAAHLPAPWVRDRLSTLDLSRLAGSFDHLPLDRQMAEEVDHLLSAHLIGMPLPVVQNVPTAPVDVRLLCSNRVVSKSNLATNAMNTLQATKA